MKLRITEEKWNARGGGLIVAKSEMVDGEPLDVFLNAIRACSDGAQNITVWRFPPMGNQKILYRLEGPKRNVPFPM